MLPKNVLKDISTIGVIPHIGSISTIGTIGTIRLIDAISAKAQKFEYSTNKHNSYMDDLYPSMNSYEARLASPAEIYLYTCILIGLLMLITFIWIKEPERYYKIKRKNTDEAPVITV